MRAALVALARACVLAPSALASRSPTFSEREHLVRALPAIVRNAPVDCAWLKMRVSNSGRYAFVDPVYLNTRQSRCVRYATDGFFILKKGTEHWRVVYVGSDFPPCSKRYPRDLVSCMPRTTTRGRRPRARA